MKYKILFVITVSLLAVYQMASTVLGSGYGDPESYTQDCSGCSTSGASCDQKERTAYQCFGGTQSCPSPGSCEATGESGTCKKSLLSGWYCDV